MRSQWTFTQPQTQTLPEHTTSPFSLNIKPREPPVFTGERGQDFVSWLRTVEDYLEVMTCSEQQAIVYVISLLAGNARIWWDAECISRGNKRPESLEELKGLLRAQFESPIRENRAKTKLLKLSQKKGEDSCTYMARMKSLLHKVPGFEEKNALQLWIYGLRQPFQFEVAKVGPKTLAEAELLVARMEDVYSGKADSDQQNNKNKRGKNAGKTGRILRNRTRAPNGGNIGPQGQGSQGGYGQAEQPRLSLPTGPHFHPGNQSRESGQSGRGRIQRKPKVAVMATSKELRKLADQMDREAEQHSAVSGGRFFAALAERLTGPRSGQSGKRPGRLVQSF
jgi:hypothetical protein